MVARVAIAAHARAEVYYWLRRSTLPSQLKQVWFRGTRLAVGISISDLIVSSSAGMGVWIAVGSCGVKLLE